MDQPLTVLNEGTPISDGKKVRQFGIRDKFGYLFGDLGNDFFFTFTSTFLLVFYTDIFHIHPATVGVLFLIARLWDAVADVTWGRFIDTRKSTNHGKFKPWILRMSFPLVLTGILMFVKIPGMSNGFYLAWAFVTYILWGTLYSTVNIPYGSMASVITDDPVKRTTLSTWRSMGGMLAALIINVIVPLVVFVDNKMDENRIFMVALVFGILAMTCYIACYKLSTERVTGLVTEKQKLNLGSTMKGLIKNKPLISFLVVSLIFMVSTLLSSAVTTYLYKDYFGDTKLLSLGGLIGMISIFLAMPLAKPLVARFGKKEIAASGLAVAAGISLLLYFLRDLSAIQFVLISAISAFSLGFFTILIWAFVTDVIDYHEYLTNIREDATVYSIYSMARKIGQAISGGIGGFAIGAVGYNAELMEQSQIALDKIYSLATLIPAIIYFVMFLILVFLYPLNKKRTIQLTTDLAERRQLRK
ncbi:glycoside-pentoside-hexuronide (GPH):cation symporter [Neobacillus sp. 179-J 1A1 HS]|uniref:MFS transporter n=1 Tax=Neobacillus driksii TaxID=3035913 RepID=UPI0035BC784B